MVFRFIISLIVVLIPLQKAITQVEDVKFNYYSVEHGIPESSIHSIFQDDKGYMWFGTMGGLCKFDGYRFISYPFFKSETIYSIYSDKEKIMWFGSSKGLVKFNPKNNSLKRYLSHPTSKDSLIDNQVISIFEDRFNNLWIATIKGINIYNRERDNFFRIESNNKTGNFAGNALKSLFLDKSGNIWIGGEGSGLSLINAGELKHFSDQKEVDKINIYSFKLHNSRNLKLNSNDVAAIYENKKGELWVGTLYDGINIFKKEELLKIVNQPKTVIKMSSIKAKFLSLNNLGSNKILCFYEDRFGNFWVGTYGGGLHMYLGNGQFNRYISNEYMRGSISNDFIQAIFEDRSGNLWIGTSGGGVNKCNVNKIVFKVFKRSYSNPERGLYENMVFSILQDREKDLWIGTRNGLSVYRNSTKKFYHYSNNPKYLLGVRNDMTRALALDSSGNIWIGTAKYGLIKLDKKNNKFTSYTTTGKNSDGISYNNVRSLLMDGKDQLWIGTIDGIDVLNVNTGKFSHFYGTDDTTSLSSSYVYYIYKDNWNNIWVCTKHGLSLYNRQTNKFTRFYFDRFNTLNEIATVTQDKAGSIWFGTTKDGVYKLIPVSYKATGEPVFNQTSKLQKLTDKPPLGNDFIYSIRTDNNGKVWFGTNHGLWRLDPETNHLKRFDVNDGLQSNEFNTNASFKTSDGTLYFGGVNGMNSFNPSKIVDIYNMPEIVLTSFKVYDKPRDFPEGIENVKEINLTYEDKYFSFEFAALDFTDPDHNGFAYKLEGFDKDWISAGNRHYASYTNLEGGDYVFKVIGANKDNIWNETGITIKIHITPPFYKTVIFQIIAALSVVSIGFFIVRFRTRKLDEQNKKLELMVKKRTQEIKDSEDRYRGFVTQTTEGIWRCEFKSPIPINLKIDEQVKLIIDSAFIAECNDVMAKILGFTKSEDVVGSKIEKVLTSNKNELIEFLKNFHYSNYKLVDEKLDRSDSEGNIRHISNNLIGIVENGFLVRAWGIMTDLTEKIKLEEEVMKHQKLESLGILAGGLAHDFNNLLTGILGNISLAKLYSNPENKAYKRLNEAEKAAVRAKDLTFQLLTFSKGGAPIKKNTDLRKTITDTVEFTLSGSKSKGIISIQDDLWSVNCDEGQISQVLSNLVINADQAMQGGGTIEVTAKNVDYSEDGSSIILNKGKYILISVKDSGEGIKPENLSKIYDPFYTTKSKGKGLGLTSVYSIIKRHGGFIDVDSELGIGTQFNIYLPITVGVFEEKAEPKPELIYGTGKILVMDDEEMIRDFAQELLQELGYKVETASDGNEAILKYKESLGNEKFKAVILDLTIPGGMNGIETAKKILELDPNAIMFVSSGYSNDPVLSEYKSYGFADIIPKPYKIEEIYSKLSILSKEKKL